MAFVPRRRLVLANTQAARAHPPWSTSQMPWDIEEAFTDTAQDLDVSSQAACHTQEAAVRWSAISAHEAQAPGPSFVMNSLLQPTQSSAAQTQADSDAYDPQACQQLFTDTPHSSHVQPQISSATMPVSLTKTEYAEMYGFLTKGTGTVQASSAKEHSLYKLSDLRQV